MRVFGFTTIHIFLFFSFLKQKQEENKKFTQQQSDYSAGYYFSSYLIDNSCPNWTQIFNEYSDNTQIDDGTIDLKELKKKKRKLISRHLPFDIVWIKQKSNGMNAVGKHSKKIAAEVKFHC